MFTLSPKWKEKLSPFQNPDIVWFYIFLPALIGYIYLLHEYVNQKPLIGSIDVLDPSFHKLIYKNQGIEVLAQGQLLQWTEGPLWIEDDNNGYLIFSDTITNRIYRWEQGKGFFTVGKTLLLKQSGCYTNTSYCDEMYEPGSNGLLRLPPNKFDPAAIDLLACQHGERAIGVLKSNGTRFALATHFRGRRFNSPNDIIWSPEGNIYFTDPKYGLYTKSRQVLEPEIPVSGIYMIRKEHIQESLEKYQPTKKVEILARDLKWPNGLAFSPDYSKLYVSNSNLKNPILKAYEVNDDGTLGKGAVFFNATSLYTDEILKSCSEGSNPVLDGLKVDIHGNVFASGPGGILVISPEGKLIGRFNFDRPVTNMIFGSDGRLYITAKDLVARVWLKTKPNRIMKMRW